MTEMTLPGQGGVVGCDRSSRNFLAAALLRQIQAMRLEVDGVRQAEDIECIHRMRVASRRARNLLRLMSGCVGEKRLQNWGLQLRGITRALGAARDTDVQMEVLAEFEAALSEPRARPGVRRLLLRLRQQRSGLQARLLKVLDRLEKEKGLEKIEKQLSALLASTSAQVPADKLEESTDEAGEEMEEPVEEPVGAVPDSVEEADQTAGAGPSSHKLYRRAAYYVGRCLDDFLSYEPFIHDPDNILELHAMRISAKHLRYTLETFGPLFSDGLEDEIRMLRKVQENLGTIHDCDVWAAYLPTFIEEERARAREYHGNLRGFSILSSGLNLFAQARAEERAATYDQFIRQWDKSVGRKPLGAWEALRQRVNQPLLPRQIYPPSAEGAANG